MLTPRPHKLLENLPGSDRIEKCPQGGCSDQPLLRKDEHDVDVLLLDEPTRGIDVASKAHVHWLIDELAVGDPAVLMVSSYLPELCWASATG